MTEGVFSKTRDKTTQGSRCRKQKSNETNLKRGNVDLKEMDNSVYDKSIGNKKWLENHKWNAIYAFSLQSNSNQKKRALISERNSDSTRRGGEIMSNLKCWTKSRK